MPLSRSRLRQLADAVESAPTFRMDVVYTRTTSTHNCGTPACVAGWGFEISGARASTESDSVRRDPGMFPGFVMRECSDWLGAVDFEHGLLMRRLYLARTASKRVDRACISRSEAAETLRRLADTGRVEWPQRVREVLDESEIPHVFDMTD